jgi:hypothetical protein
MKTTVCKTSETTEIFLTDGNYSIRQLIIPGHKETEVYKHNGEETELVDKHAREVSHMFTLLHNFKVENNIY